MTKLIFLLWFCALFTACANTKQSAFHTSSETKQPPICYGVKAPKVTGCEGAAVDKTWDSVIEAGLTVETFTQQFKGETVTRRYLQYIPENLDREQASPLVFVLHGAHINAEITRAHDTHTDLEAIADKEGFVVIYGNALSSPPEPQADKFFANSGIWNTVDGVTPDQEKLDNDLNYFLTIIENVKNEGVSLNEKEIFIGGISNGGLMTLLAVENLPSTFRAGFAGVPAPTTKRFSRNEIDVSMMFYYSENDPVFLPYFENTDITYAELTKMTIDAWALAIGVNKDLVNNWKYIPIEDSQQEGKRYTGSAPIALNTTKTRLEEVRAFSEDGENEVWIIRSERAGHAIPHPTQFDIETVEKSTGFRNQDVNSIELMWNFFSQFID